jgi:hypothetical protein
VEWLRRGSRKIALLTNGQQWRLIYAGLDAEAWCEWDIDLWFEQGEPSQQVLALRCLLAPEALTAKDGQVAAPLIEAIDATRRGQAELTSALGERVRDAVESLIQASDEVLKLLGTDGEKNLHPRDVYIAATRMVMRCVVILFAEARNLLPRDNRIYYDSYSLQGLREQLDRFAGGRSRERLRHSCSSWPRLISLFRLVYKGSPHEGLPITRFAGGLFEPGDKDSRDLVSRAIAAFENPRNAPSDYWIHRILELLTRSRVKVRQGIRAIEVETPIDFSDLSSEYIGILYESLLDYQLRQARSNEPIVFLNLGDQPALPLPRLQALSSDALTKMFEKFNQKSKGTLSEDEEETEEGESEDEDETKGQEEQAPDQASEDNSSNKLDRQVLDPTLEDQVRNWARKAVVASGIVKKTRGKPDPRKQREYDTNVDLAAGQLYTRIVRAGDWYLVREGATRKGSGTFYTRPQLASPITRRALQPLLYDGGVPRAPEEILALRICDPAMGSGSFLISALRYTTNALLESLYHHGRLVARGDGTIARLADGLPVDHPSQETLPLPANHPQFDDYLEARLRRHVVERCLYGVDNDLLAVELSRMSLWVETMDPRLPFGFLNHKLKLGNALVGCWFDRFQDYPVTAWEREGGDKSHDRFVHHFRLTAARGSKAGAKKGDKWTVAIKQKKDAVVLDEVKALILRNEQPAFAFVEEQMSPSKVHDQAMAVFERLHALPVHEVEERKRVYEEEIASSPTFRELKEAFDTWCAIWFWPGDLLELAPYPTNLLKPPEPTREIVRELARQFHFFHWELEFADVFTGPNSGFSAVIGNPPWEIQKPNSKEFFSNIDPMYRGYGKQEALDQQKQYFQMDAATEKSWIEYCARLKALTNWTKFVGHPFGDRVTYDKDRNPKHDFSLDSDFEESAKWHRDWQKLRRERTGYVDPEHPFAFQGSADINTYKMFLEVAHHVLRPGGWLGFLVPSGIYSDKGAATLRLLFLSESRWTNLYAFQNERFVFDSVHHSFKIAAIHVEKRGKSGPLMTRFRLGPGDSPEVTELEEDLLRDSGYLPVSRAQIRHFSPRSGSVLELRSTVDLNTAERLYKKGNFIEHSPPAGWQARHITEFHITNDSQYFPPRWKWEEQGFRADEHGLWLKGPWVGGLPESTAGTVLSADGAAYLDLRNVEAVALPLYQGVMINQFDYCYKALIEPKDRTWQFVQWTHKLYGPKYLMALEDFSKHGTRSALHRVAFRGIARTTDQRTMIAAAVPALPSADTMPFLACGDCVNQVLLSAALNSFVTDWIQRSRQSGARINSFLLSEIPLLPRSDFAIRNVTSLAARLSLPSWLFHQQWLKLKETGIATRVLWALTPHERLRIRVMLEAIIAYLFGLDSKELARILAGCDYPTVSFQDKKFARTLDPKGFWRSEREVGPELRLAVLVQVAYRELDRVGIDEFVNQQENEGWMLPEMLRLADYDLGHDERARDPQPVAACFGPRFHSWQLEQGVEQSWEECERHGEILNQLLPPKLDEEDETDNDEGAPKDLFGDPVATDLFGDPILPNSKKR